MEHKKHVSGWFEKSRERPKPLMASDLRKLADEADKFELPIFALGLRDAADEIDLLKRLLDKS